MQGKVEICGVNTSKLKVLKNEETMELLRRTQRGKGQTGQPLSCMAHTHRVHSSGGSFSFAPESFRASSRRGSFRFTAHHRPQG